MCGGGSGLASGDDSEEKIEEEANVRKCDSNSDPVAILVEVSTNWHPSSVTVAVFSQVSHSGCSRTTSHQQCHYNLTYNFTMISD